MAVPLKVLLIEDSELDAALTLDALATDGFDVRHERVDSRRGVLAALERAWDVIISDFSMPGFSGSEALALVMERGIDTPFIFVSGVLGEIVAVDAMRAGARDYVPKDHLVRLGPAVHRELSEAENRLSRRASEEALRLEQLRYRDIFETSGFGIAELDLSGLTAELDRIGRDPGALDRTLAQPSEARDLLAQIRVRDANEASLALVGATGLDVLIAAMPDELVATIVDQLARGAPARDHQVELADPSGQRRHVLFNLRSPRRGDARHSTVMTLLDITERRNLELQRNATQRMESLGRLAGGVAHDFNNLLSVIMTFTELVRDTLPAQSREHADLGSVLEASSRASDLASQLLVFGRNEPQRETTFSPNAAIEASLKLLRRLIGDHIEIKTHLSADVVPIHMERGQFDQIVLNLVVNARDAMPHGGRITISTAPILRIEADGTARQFAGVTVRDTGHGMTEKVRARVFEPFFTTKEIGRGTGLGLTTVYGIVQGARGTIEVDSSPGNGARFTVVIPAAAVAEVRPAAALRTSAPGGHGRVLVVDDNALAREGIRRTLEANGYDVVAVSSSVAALAVTGEVDLVISDHLMPGGTGSNLRAAVRDRWPRARFLLISGYAGDVLARAARDGDPLEFLAKPFTRQTLLATVADLLAV